MSGNGHVTIESGLYDALKRLTFMANISQAHARLQHACFDGLAMGEKPDEEVVLVCLRHLRSEVDKAGKRLAKQMREA